MSVESRILALEKRADPGITLHLRFGASCPSCGGRVTAGVDGKLREPDESNMVNILIGDRGPAPEHRCPAAP